MIDLVDVSKSYGPGLPAVNHANLHVITTKLIINPTNASEKKPEYNLLK